MEHKFEVGDKVIHNGLIAKVESKSTYAGSGDNCYGLVAIADEEMSCTASEDECEAYIGQDVDESEALSLARYESARIAHIGNSLTDKYFRDGNH